MQLLSTILLLAATAQAHYRFSKLVVNGVADTKEWTYIRETKNYQDDHGVTSVDTVDIRCFQMGKAGGTASIPAGGTLGFIADQGVSHPGPILFYMAKVPAGKTIDSWDGSGAVWFKSGYIGPNITAKGLNWVTYQQKGPVSFQVPKAVPSGDYLVRVESIALHQAQAVGGAQFYLGCAQVTVTDGGSGVPGPLVAFPGAYKASDPGLILLPYPTPTTYSPPGPAVWVG